MSSLLLLRDIFLEERERWFYWLPVLLGVGIVAYFMLPSEPATAWLVLTPLLIVSAWSTRRWPATNLSLLAVLVLVLGFNAALLESRLFNTIMLPRDTGPTGITGRLLVVEPVPDGARITLDQVVIDRVRPEQTPQQVRLKIKQDADSLPSAGSWLEFYGELGPPSAPVAPGAFDFRRQAYFQGIGAIGWTYGDFTEIAAPEDNRTSWWLEFELTMERMRRALAATVHQQLDGPEAAIVAALLTGSQSGIDVETMQDMRASGLAHLLSISGIHVSMVGVLIYWPLRALLALVPFLALHFPIKKWAAVIAILGTLGYTFLVGVQTPTLRSALMTAILMLAIIADRRVLSMRLVAMSALIVLLIFPSALLGPSFQMSFAAVLAMIALYEKPLDAALRQQDAFQLAGWLDFLRRHAGSIIFTSLAATAATTPFSLYHFQSFSFYGVVANMIAIPLTSFWIMPCLMLTYILAPFGLEGWVLQGAGWGAEAIIWLAAQVASWPFAIIRLIAMPMDSFLAIVLGGLWLCLWQRRWRYLGLVPILVGMLYPLYTKAPDLLIDAEGKQWAVRLTPDRYAVADPGKEKFTLQQWQQRLGYPEFVAAANTEQPELLRCDLRGCVIRKGEAIMALPKNQLALAEDCLMATLVIAPNDLQHCSAPQKIAARDLRRYGAHSLSWAEDGSFRIDHAIRDDGLRPWEAGFQGKSASF